jgi:hypothetical protein
MKRILLVAVSSTALSLAAPAIASAHHHGTKRHHKHHAAKVRVLDFRASAAPSTSSPTTPTTPATETAGKVTSFKEGVLTITLTDGTPVSGKVTEQTELHCTPATPGSGGEDNDDQSGSGEGDQGSSGEARASESSRNLAHVADNGGDGGGDGADEGQQSCTTAALVEGAMVREAELSITSAGAVWDHVDLIQ